MSLWLLVAAAALVSCAWADPECRFAYKYSSAALLKDEETRTSFLRDIVHFEGKFQADGIGYDVVTGHTYDGHMLDYVTGQALPGGLHVFSAPSKECIHVALLTLALAGDSYAQDFVLSSSNVSGANVAQSALNFSIDLMARKMDSYEAFNATFPGYGGFLPWVKIADGRLLPADGWSNQVPALDNGELIWALYSCAFVLRSLGEDRLADRIRAYIAYQASTARTVFYTGDGNVRWVSLINDTAILPTPANYYGPSYPGDPYEGELFTWFMDLFVSWDSPQAREQPWLAKRAMLKAVNYTTRAGATITVQRGYWYSAHENWKIAFLPYFSIPIADSVFRNCERARTAYSADRGIPGMFACVNDVAKGPGYPIPDYVADVGIPPLAYISNVSWRFDLITPYSVYPLALVNRTAAIVWYHNMLLGPRMQGPYGSTEACNVNGTEISPLLTWDSKITTVLGLLGGIGDIAERALRSDGYWNRFYAVIDREYTRVFGTGPLPGEQVDYALPTATVSASILGNFTQC